MNIIINESGNFLGGVETFLGDLATLLHQKNNIYFLVAKENNYFEKNDSKHKYKYIYKRKSTPIEYLNQKNIKLERNFVNSQLDTNNEFIVISLFFSSLQYAMAVFGDNQNIKLLYFWQHPQHWVEEVSLLFDTPYITSNTKVKRKKFNYQKKLLLALQENYADYCGLNKGIINYNSWFYETTLTLNPNSFPFPVLSKCTQSSRYNDIQEKSKLKVLWLGRFDYFKNDAIRYIYKSLENLSNIFPNYIFEFSLVGYGLKEYEEEIIHLANHSKVKTNLLGKVDFEKIPKLFAKYDLGIGMGLSVKHMADCSLSTILIDSINHSDIQIPSCNWIFDAGIDDAGDGYYQQISGSSVSRKTLIELLNPILNGLTNLNEISKKSKYFFDEHYSMENNLVPLLYLISESKFCGLNHEVYSATLIEKLVYIYNSKFPHWIKKILKPIYVKLRPTISKLIQ